MGKHRSGPTVAGRQYRRMDCGANQRIIRNVAKNRLWFIKRSRDQQLRRNHDHGIDRRRNSKRQHDPWKRRKPYDIPEFPETDLVETPRESAFVASLSDRIRLIVQLRGLRSAIMAFGPVSTAEHQASIPPVSSLRVNASALQSAAFDPKLTKWPGVFDRYFRRQADALTLTRRDHDSEPRPQIQAYRHIHIRASRHSIQ